MSLWYNLISYEWIYLWKETSKAEKDSWKPPGRNDSVVVARATDERGGVLIDKSKRFVEIDR